MKDVTREELQFLYNKSFEGISKKRINRKSNFRTIGLICILIIFTILIPVFFRLIQ